MKKIFKQFIFGLSQITLVSLITLSCSNNQTNQKLLKINFGSGLNTQQIQNFEAEINNLIIAKGGDFTIKISSEGDINDYNKNLDDLIKNKQDIVFVSSGKLLAKKSDLQNNNINLGIQTYTKMFKGSNNNSETYLNGLDNDPLRSLAQKQQTIFDKIPRSQWDDQNNGNNYANYLYNNFYTNNLTNYYRGMIYIVANEQDTKEIIEAWNNKDLTKFLSYGYVHSNDKESGSKYILPQALLKKHFGTKFTSFLELINQNANYKLDSKPLANIYKSSLNNQKIFFDAEGVYSWTKYKQGNDPFTINNQTRPGHKFTFLTVTDALLYNIAIYKNHIPSAKIKILAEVLKELAQTNQDIWGPMRGFYSYKYINDVNKEVWEILNNIGK